MRWDCHPTVSRVRDKLVLGLFYLLDFLAKIALALVDSENAPSKEILEACSRTATHWQQLVGNKTTKADM